MTENGTTTTEITSYLIDAANHTGYQQVLEETVTDGNGNLLKKIVYTIGHDHISQTTFTPGGPAQGTTAVFHMDGHGSTRILTDFAGTVVTVAGLAQVFHFDAYGNALNFNMSNAATQYLYSGEQFDARIQQQYLRARYYNQATGTFNRLDPFMGNLNDPQSLHKYLYTHADPVNGLDPTGLFSGGEMMVTISAGDHIDTMDADASAAFQYKATSVLEQQGAKYAFRAAVQGAASSVGVQGMQPLIQMIGALLAMLGVAIVIRIQDEILDMIEDVQSASGDGGGSGDPPPGTDRDENDRIVYGPLDHMQRATGVVAKLSSRSMRSEAEAAGHVFTSYPSWWNQIGTASNGVEWDRAHLLGKSIGGLGQKFWRNMVPFERFANRGGGSNIGVERGMSGPEKEVRSAAALGQKVFVLVEPNFSGDNMVPDSVSFLIVGKTAANRYNIVNQPNPD